MRGVWLLLLLTGCCSAQQGEYVLAGSVVNSRTGDPVKRALVTAFRLPTPADMGDGPVARPTPAQPFSATAFTDVSGVFRFTGLASGTYNLSAQKPHFTEPPTERKPVQIESSSKEDVRLDLSPLGTIEGKITDQRGQPGYGISVHLMQTTIRAGWRQTEVVRDVWTDDRGIFRAWDIAPGRYLVRAAGRNSSMSAYINDGDPTNRGAYEGYVPAYFGGPTADSATPIIMEPGTEARADFSVMVQPAHKVRGRLENLGTGDVKFALVSGDEEVGTGRVAFNKASGAFEMREVLNGNYTLRATQGNQAVAEMPLIVDGSDVEALRLTLEGPVEIPVNVRISGQPELPETRRESLARPGSPESANLPGFCQATLHGADPGSVPSQSRGGATISALPGRYRVGIFCFAAYPVSIALGTSDLLADPSITVSPGAAPAPIEIVARHGGGMITGAIKLDQEPAGKIMWVLAVPSVSTRDPELAPAFDRSGGQFFLNSLAPGDYTLYAFSTDQIEYRNPEFLRGLTGGESVHVEDGATATVTITRLAQ
jgi:hypothetical protein